MTADESVLLAQAEVAGKRWPFMDEQMAKLGADGARQMRALWVRWAAEATAEGDTATAHGYHRMLAYTEPRIAEQLPREDGQQ